MVNIDLFFDEVDTRRVARARELSEIKHKFVEQVRRDPLGVSSKAVLMLSYAHWEGFYNDCSECYISFLRELGCKICDVEWLLLLGALDAELKALQDRNHSYNARCDFLESLQTKLESEFEDFEGQVISARSNLNFHKLRQNYRVLNFDTRAFDSKRIRIDKELVGWRHSIAHGESPNLTAFDISSHIDFTSELLIVLSDQFQEAMLSRV